MVLLDSTTAAKESNHKDEDSHPNEDRGGRQVAGGDEVQVGAVVSLDHRTHDDHSKPAYLKVERYSW